MSRHARVRSPSSKRPRGQAVTEFALVIPILLVLFIGLFDLGRLVYGYNTIANAARIGARVAVVNQHVATIQQTAAGFAIALDVPASCSGSGGPGVCVAPATPCGVASCMESVTVTFRFTPITPLVSDVVGPVVLSSTSRMPVESVCADAGCPNPYAP